MRGVSKGVSKGVYASMNLALHVADEAQLVIENRRLYALELGAQPVFLNQIHGTQGVELNTQMLEVEHSSINPISADWAWTTEPGVACTVMVADCMPLLLADSLGRAVAAVHVGWRGLVGLNTFGVAPELDPQGGIIAQAVQTLKSRLPSPSNQDSFEELEPQPRLFAWLGPCIGPTAFEVGPEVRDWFLSRYSKNECAFIQSQLHPGKWMAHLPWLVEMELQRQGVARLWGNLPLAHDPWSHRVDPWCTVSNHQDFFSFRRQGVCGRFAASIWLERSGLNS